MQYFPELISANRLLITAELYPVMGDRLQPTGFKDLGAATYTLPHSKTPMLLVESAQSVANRLEQTILDIPNQTVVQPLKGISYVEVQQKQLIQATSILEAHRLNSPYILNAQANGKRFFDQLQEELKGKASDYAAAAKVIAKYDLNSLLHGVFFSQSEIEGGRIKISRALSGFIEARNVAVVSSGGVKLDRVNPQGNTKKGEGNIPYYRDEYVAETITAYFNLDLQQLRSYRLGGEQQALNTASEDLLVAIAIWKILQFLKTGLRLRTACDLECLEISVKQPFSYKIPTYEELTQKLPELVTKASALFATPSVTVLEAVASNASKNAKPESREADPTVSEESVA